MLGAAASVSESFGELAATIVMRTSALSTSFFDATSTSLDAMTNAWRGIDLTQLEVRQARGRVSADAPEVISLWLASKAGRIVHQCQDEAVLLFWLSVLESVSTEMPTLQSQRASLVANGSFVSSAVMVNYLISGHVAFQYDFSQVHFLPRWVNPLWEMWGSAVEQESPQIERMLEHVLSAVPQQNITFTPLSTGEVYWTLPELWHVKVARARRLLTHSLQAFSKLGSSGILWGCGMLSGLVVMALFARACKSGWIGFPRWGWQFICTSIYLLTSAWKLSCHLWFVISDYGLSSSEASVVQPEILPEEGTSSLLTTGPAAGFEKVDETPSEQGQGTSRASTG